jgi:hypothetical protein
VKVVEFVPAGTMTELAPRSSRVLLLDSKTSVPPIGAAPFNVAVHVVEAPEFKLFGLQVSWETEICPKAQLAIKKPSIPVKITLMMPFMKPSHNDLTDELNLLQPAVRRPTGLLPVDDVKVMMEADCS